MTLNDIKFKTKCERFRLQFKIKQFSTIIQLLTFKIYNLNLKESIGIPETVFVI